jgi:hypothetical protein
MAFLPARHFRKMATIDSRSALAARAARFRREEQRPPPPLPTNRITVSEGKVVTSDKDVALRKLLERKAVAGVPLTADQQRVLSSLGASANQMSSRSASQLKPAPSRGTMSTSQPKKTAGKSNTGHRTASPAKAGLGDFLRKKEHDPKEENKLRRKIRDCEALELAAAAGATLEANQRSKMEGKAALVAELERLLLAQKR